MLEAGPHSRQGSTTIKRPRYVSLLLLRFRRRSLVLNCDCDRTAAGGINVRAFISAGVLANRWRYTRRDRCFLLGCGRLSKEIDAPSTKSEREYIHENG